MCLFVCFVDLFQELKIYLRNFFFHREKVVEDGKDVEEEEAPKYITDSLLCLFVCPRRLAGLETPPWLSRHSTAMRKKTGETKT